MGWLLWFELNRIVQVQAAAALIRIKSRRRRHGNLNQKSSAEWAEPFQ
ncbi:hypothetical protein SL1157_1380 [Ruegeria lacuscaerulensis ITI-1157]|nr:hypothetical protein SL1157_1380 [Ruegeria lacuscaerulensis ITI-1157]